MLVEPDIFGNSINLEADSLDLIRRHEPPEGYYCCFSGGKDSIVLESLMRKSGVKYDLHMNLTSVDPPELLRFIRKQYPECQFNRPAKTMFQLIRQNGMPPTRLARFCCRLLKENYGRGRVKATGIRWEESPARRLRKAYEMDDAGGYFLHPIIEWASDEIWEYIKENNLPYPSLYDEGFHRIGCIGCPQGNKQRHRQFERWPQFKKAYYNTFQRVIDDRKTKGRDDTGGYYKDVETMWAWWMGDIQPKDPGQTVMFE